MDRAPPLACRWSDGSHVTARHTSNYWEGKIRQAHGSGYIISFVVAPVASYLQWCNIYAVCFSFHSSSSSSSLLLFSLLIFSSFLFFLSSSFLSSPPPLLFLLFLFSSLLPPLRSCYLYIFGKLLLKVCVLVFFLGFLCFCNVLFYWLRERVQSRKMRQ